MRPSGLLAIAGVVVAATLAQAREPRAPDLREVERRVGGLTNELRLAEGRARLEPDPRLDAAARELARVMAATGRLAHDADGKRPWDRAREHRYSWCLVGENIAYRYMSRHFLAHELAEDFVRDWKDSPGHRKNMVDANMVHIGVAVARSPATGGYYAVQLFARPSGRDC